MTEAELQTKVANYFRLVLGPDVFWFHPVNEGKRGWKAQRDFKRFGGRSGVPDLLILHDGRTFWLELKTAKGRLSPAQTDAHHAIRKAGGHVAVCRTLAEVQNVLLGWALPTRLAMNFSLGEPKENLLGKPFLKGVAT